MGHSVGNIKQTCPGATVFALTTIVGVLVEVPVMLTLVKVANKTK
jgi:ACR3 family arsenite efflux pump ArsB